MKNARTTYRSTAALSDALADLALFHAMPFEALEADREAEVAVAAVEETMTRDEAESILAVYTASKRGGRPPKDVLRARAIVRGEVYVDPRKGRSMSQITVSAPTEDRRMACPGDDAQAFARTMRAFADSALALAVRESQLCKLAERFPDDARVAKLLRANGREAAKLYDRLRRMWPEGVAVWDERGHLMGADAAERNNDGTHWTASAKGNATTIRYGDGDYRPTNKRHVASMPTEGVVDEDALAELAEALIAV